jgi:hypothetical protein
VEKHGEFCFKYGHLESKMLGLPIMACQQMEACGGFIRKSKNVTPKETATDCMIHSQQNARKSPCFLQFPPYETFLV